jgi:hypothetical protein
VGENEKSGVEIVQARPVAQHDLAIADDEPPSQEIPVKR